MYLYRRKKAVSLIVNLMMTILSIALGIYTCYLHNLRVGVFALENYYLFSTLFTKPYAKFATHSSGVVFAFFYCEVLKYRKASTSEKEQNFKLIHAFNTKHIFGKLSGLLGTFLIVYMLLNSYPAVKDPYAWSMLENAMYFGFSRIGFTIGMMLLFFSVVFGTN